jgi:hypothetical protein
LGRSKKSPRQVPSAAVSRLLDWFADAVAERVARRLHDAPQASAATVPPPPTGLLTEPEAATQIRQKVEWLRKRRKAGTGPPFVKTGKSYKYRLAALTAWLDGLTVTPPPARPSVPPSSSASGRGRTGRRSPR